MPVTQSPPARRRGQQISKTRAKPNIRRLTLDEVRQLPATCQIEDAAAALGISRAKAYTLYHAGQFPVRVLPVGGRLKVLTSSLLAVLGIGDPAPERVA